MDCLIIGSVNTDSTFYLNSLPKPGETLLANSFASSLGGKGANQAVAFGKLGGKGTFACSIGNDQDGGSAIKEIRATGLKVKAKTGMLPTGRATIYVDSRSENSIVVLPGANSEMDNGFADEAIASLAKPGIVLLQMEIPFEVVCHSLKTSKENGHMAILNPAPARKLPDEVLPYIDVLTPNQGELGILTDQEIATKEDILLAADTLIGKGVKNVIVTLGSKGAFWTNGKDRAFYPSVKVKAIDTVGAGDCFNGALAFGLSTGMEMEGAVQFAIKAAAISVTRKGASKSMPTLSEVNSL